MDIKRKILNHYNRWNIAFDSEQALIKFRNRVAVIIKTYFSFIPKLIDDKFAYLYGCSADILPLGCFSYDIRSSYVYAVVSKTETTQELATALQCFFIALEVTGYTEQFELADAIKEAIELSPGVGLRVVKNKGSVTFYPAETE
jgi:hypothetical protein